MADSSKPGFQVPPEMRAFAEQSMDQARKAFDSVVMAAQNAASSFEGQTTAAQANVKDVQRKVVSFTEQNVAASFELARKLLAAKDGEELMKVHADYVKSQMQALADQARELSSAATRAATGKAKD